MLMKHVETVKRAYYAISFSPEKRGVWICTVYSQELADDVKFIQDHGKDPSLYIQKYEQYFLRWISAKGRVMSAAIVGPAKFPTRRNEKMCRWEDGAFEKFRKFRKLALKRITKKPKPSIDDSIEWSTLKIEKEEQLLEMMKGVNKYLRKNKTTTVENLVTDLMLSEDTARRVLNAGNWWGIGFPSFSITNCRNRLRSAEERLVVLSRKKDLAITGNAEYKKTINGEECTVIENHEIDRIQIIFNGKPKPETIVILKKTAMKWAPSQGAWQRQFTKNAEFSIKRIFDK
jgi:hypothetical protein